MSAETVYSSAPFFSAPRQRLATVRSELRTVPGTASRLFVRGLQAEHRQNRLGYVWLFVPAVASTFIWVYLAEKRVLVTADTPGSYVLYVLTGTLLFQLFVDSLTAPLRRLDGARAVLTKSRLPHESWILAGALEALFALAVRLLLFVPVLIWTATPVGWELLLAPVGVLGLLLLGLSIGLLLAPLGLLYRDVRNGMTVVAAFWFFLTPVIYPVPDTFLVELNPVTPVLVSARAWLIGGGDDPAGLAVVMGGSVALLAVSWVVYRVAQPHLVERL